MPRIGDQAPDFDALTTTGPMKFSEYMKDSWVILFSHPADFTPVCTTELSGFAQEKKWFAERNTKLIGESIDSIHSHVAWVQNVREKTGVYMDFPIIADIDMKVARLYGMLHDNASSTAAVRAVFFIDPKGIIRLIMYYPPVSYTHLRAHETVLDLVCRLLLEKKQNHKQQTPYTQRIQNKITIQHNTLTTITHISYTDRSVSIIQHTNYM